MAASQVINFTKALLDKVSPPPKGERLVLRDARVQGLELRVTSTGAKTFSIRRRVKNGDVERVTIGAYPAIPVDLARDKAKAVIAQHATGVSFVKAARKAKREGLSVGQALEAFVLTKRNKYGQPMKTRTQADYLGMIREPGQSPRGHTHVAGELHALAGRQLRSLTGPVLKAHFARLSAKSPTRAAYSMRVMRAVLNFNGVKIEDDPFDRKTPETDRLALHAPKARDRKIPTERLHDWWQAAGTIPNGDTFQFLLLTGMRRGEVAGLRQSDVDLESGRLRLPDTKNGKPHVVMLSRQALQIVKTRAANKEDDDLVFVGSGAPPKALAAIIAATGVEFSAHDCRRTFASVAVGMLPGYVTKKMLNHTDGNDVTGTHYVNLDESTLRAGWQTVADAILGGAGPAIRAASSGNVVSLDSRRKA